MTIEQLRVKVEAAEKWVSDEQESLEATERRYREDLARHGLYLAKAEAARERWRGELVAALDADANAQVDAAIAKNEPPF